MDAYRRAVDLYPNSALNRANMAEAYLAAGDEVLFRSQAEYALWLDGITPHVDKKLPAAVRERLDEILHPKNEKPTDKSPR